MRNVAASLFAALLLACRSTPQALKPRDLVTISPASGAVSAKLVPDPNSPELKLGPGEEYIAPQLMPGNPMPPYPAELIPLHLPLHVVAVRATFGEYDHAIDVSPSPVVQSTHDKYDAAFEASVRATVMHWVCYAAKIRKFRDGPGYRIMTAERRLKTFYDISFSFDIVDGHPVVKSAQ